MSTCCFGERYVRATTRMPREFRASAPGANLRSAQRSSRMSASTASRAIKTFPVSSGAAALGWLVDAAPAAVVARRIGFATVCVACAMKLNACQTIRLEILRCWQHLADTNCELLRSEEHTSELQSRLHLVCRLLLEKKKKT